MKSVGKTGEDLLDYITKFKRRGFRIPPKKGKGSKYSRRKERKIPEE